MTRRASLAALLVIAVAGLGLVSTAQAWTNAGGGDHGGANWTPGAGDTISGNHYNIGTFTIPAGQTNYVYEYNGASADTTGWLRVSAATISIQGTLSASGRGYGGGGGGQNDYSTSYGGGYGGSNGHGGNGQAGTWGGSITIGGGGGGGSPDGSGGSSNGGTAGSSGTDTAGGKGGTSSGSYVGGLGGSGHGSGGGGGGGYDAAGGGGGGGGTGGTQPTGSNNYYGGAGAGPFGGAGGTGSSSNSPTSGGNGGYRAAGVNGDTTTDSSVVRGSGGGGGGTSTSGSYGGGGGGGGAGGGFVALDATGSLTVGAAAAIYARGGGGGQGGNPNFTGILGGGGAGGGVRLYGNNVTLTSGSTIDIRGDSLNTISTYNGGTLKIWYGTLSDSATERVGRRYTKYAPSTPPVVIVAPRPGDFWQVGLRHNIIWTSSNDNRDSLVYSTDSMATWTFIAIVTPNEHTDTLPWTVPNAPSGRCYIQVNATNGMGTTRMNSGKFSIVAAPTAGSVVPAGGEFWQVGVTHNITWSSTGDSKDSLLYSTDNGTSWTYIAKDSPPHRTYAWSVPNHPSATCLVKVFAFGDPMGTPASAQSASTFNIVTAPTVSGVSPSGGVSWQAGVTHHITWSSSGDVKDSLLYSTNSGTGWTFIAKDSPPGGRNHSWSVPNTPSATCLVKVFAIADPLAPVSAQSPSTFKIVAAPTVSSVVPAGGESWQVGITHNITWASASDIKDSLVYSTDAGTSWAYVAKDSPPGSRSYAWSVPSTPSTTSLVKVFAISLDPLGPISGQSANNFNILPAPSSVALTSPVGGEVWQAGMHQNITWTSTNSTIDSIIYTRADVNWTYIGKQSPPTHTFDWTVPSTPSDSCRVWVFAKSGDPLATPIAVRSPHYFSIIPAPTVAVTAPNGGEVWRPDSIRNITWTSTNSSTDSIIWSADDGATWSFVGKQTTPIAHSFAWTVPDTRGTENLIEVLAIGQLSTVSDQSNDTFTIMPRPKPTGWAQLANVPPGGSNKPVKDGACIAYAPDAAGEYVYALKGNGRYEFDRYDINTNTWAARESIPAIGSSGKKKAVKKGAAMTVCPLRGSGTQECYAVKGNNTTEFWRYNPALSGTPTYPWAELADVPPGTRALKEGTGMARVTLHDTAFVYLLKGSGTLEFYRYNCLTSAWTRMADAPGGPANRTYKYGSAVAYDSVDNAVYVLKGSYNEVYAYNVLSNTWTTKASLPLIGGSGLKKKVKDGAGLAYLGGKLYAQKGDNTVEFWTYNIATNVWAQIQDVPTGGGKGVKGGGAMCASGISTYSLKGNSTFEFYSYTPAAFESRSGGSPSTEGSSVYTPTAYGLSTAPNPFSRLTEVSYSLPRAGNVELRLYDVSGAMVRTLVRGYVAAGSYTAHLDATGLGCGIYLLKLDAENYNTTRKLTIE